jgi:hypothetical protein
LNSILGNQSRFQPRFAVEKLEYVVGTIFIAAERIIIDYRITCQKFRTMCMARFSTHSENIYIYKFIVATALVLHVFTAQHAAAAATLPANGAPEATVFDGEFYSRAERLKYFQSNFINQYVNYFVSSGAGGRLGVRGTQDSEKILQDLIQNSAADLNLGKISQEELIQLGSIVFLELGRGNEASAISQKIASDFQKNGISISPNLGNLEAKLNSFGLNDSGGEVDGPSIVALLAQMSLSERKAILGSNFIGLMQVTESLGASSSELRSKYIDLLLSTVSSPSELYKALGTVAIDPELEKEMRSKYQSQLFRDVLSGKELENSLSDACGLLQLLSTNSNVTGVSGSQKVMARQLMLSKIRQFVDRNQSNKSVLACAKDDGSMGGTIPLDAYINLVNGQGSVSDYSVANQEGDDNGRSSKRLADLCAVEELRTSALDEVKWYKTNFEGSNGTWARILPKHVAVMTDKRGCASNIILKPMIYPLRKQARKSSASQASAPTPQLFFFKQTVYAKNAGFNYLETYGSLADINSFLLSVLKNKDR